MDITEIYRLISIIGYSLAALLLILSIAIFFLYDIKGVYSYLTGKKKQKGINELRENQASGKLNGKFKKPFAQPPKKIEPVQKAEEPTPPQAQEIAPAQPSYTSVEQYQPPVNVEIQAASQREYGETAPLEQNANEGLKVEENAANDNNTVVLSPAKPEPMPVESNSTISSTIGKFVIIKNEMVIHTSEVL